MKIKILSILILSCLLAFTYSCRRGGNNNEESKTVIEKEEDTDISGNQDIDSSQTISRIDVSNVKGGEVSKEIVSNGKPTIIDFNATWCGPCRYMAPIFHKLAKEYGDRYNFVSIDVDENSELAEKYNIQSIPAFIFLDESGKEGNRIIGRVDESEFRDELENPTWF